MYASEDQKLFLQGFELNNTSLQVLVTLNLFSDFP